LNESRLLGSICRLELIFGLGVSDLMRSLGQARGHSTHIPHPLTANRQNLILRSNVVRWIQDSGGSPGPVGAEPKILYRLRGHPVMHAPTTRRLHWPVIYVNRAGAIGRLDLGPCWKYIAALAHLYVVGRTVQIEALQRSGILPASLAQPV
jgi:hypothetical protein